jgi:pimeloyl-ACP methyl ester carboxylesterase
MAQATGANQRRQTAAEWRDRGPLSIPQGQIRVREIGEGEPLLFVHGFLVDGRLWSGVAEQLAGDFRCIVPDWPFGSHQRAMNPDADLSPPGAAEIIAAVMSALDLDQATVVGNDSGGAVSQIFTAAHPERVTRLVLTNCDMYENFPPKPFNLMPPLARIPGAMTVMAQPFRVGAMRRAGFKPFAKKEIDPELVDSWLEPMLTDGGVRADAGRFMAGANKSQTLEAAEQLKSFEKPVLLAWAPEDRVFPLSYAKRLAEAVPDARITEVADAGTFVGLDQPERVAEAIRGFVKTTA